MKRTLFVGLMIAGLMGAQEPAAKSTSGANAGATNLLEVRRIYVGAMTGGAQANALRELIISSLDSTKLFILTDNPERADAILKGAGDDKTFTDSFDTYEGNSGHSSLGKSANALTSKVSALSAGNIITENESHHMRERKHEAYATVRLINKDGDVLWSTTQESLGAKFRGASADVAAKIAHQIQMDYQKARHGEDAGTSRPTP